MIRLKRIREELGWTQEEAAAQADISQPTYSNIERGVRKPSIKTAIRIAACMGFSWSELFEGGENESEKE